MYCMLDTLLVPSITINATSASQSKSQSLRKLHAIANGDAFLPPLQSEQISHNNLIVATVPTSELPLLGK
jgi:hypothetical protein